MTLKAPSKREAFLYLFKNNFTAFSYGFYISGLPGSDKEVLLTQNSNTIISFGPKASGSVIAFLSLSVQRDELNTSSRGYCIDVMGDSSPVIQNCHITSKSSCKYYELFRFLNSCS